MMGEPTEDLRVACPTCGAEPQQRCRNTKADDKGRHRYVATHRRRIIVRSSVAEAVGIERAAGIAHLWAASHSCDHHDDNPCCHIRTGATIEQRVRELLPDPSFLSRREDVVRAETWKEAMAVVSRYGAARVHAFGDHSIPSIMDSLEAAAGSKTKVFSREDEQKNLGR